MIKSTRLVFITFAVAIGVLVAGFASPVSAVVTWALTDDSVNLNMNGVSPHVEKTAAGDRVWRSDVVPAGTAVSLCNDSGSCTTETLNTGGGPVSDFAVAQTASGLRAYFKKLDMSNNTQAVYSAPCASADCLSIGAATLTSTAMQVSKDLKAWGVPDPVRLADGRIRIYIVESPSLSSSCPEKVASYISSDGISFTKESGWRFENGYVDTEVLRAKDGEWVMIMADGPGCTDSKGNKKSQQLFVATSSDGLSWSTPQVVTTASAGRLDPTGYEVSTNVFRIYYAQGSFEANQYVLKRATLQIGQSSSEVSITDNSNATKKTSITCVKGKTSRKVTGVNPKCPSGFKKK